MPQNSPITIKDGAATPVNHVFNPKGPIGANGEHVFRDTLGTVTIDHGQVALSFSRRPSNSQSPTEKVVMKVQYPSVVTQISNGVSTDVVAYQDLCSIEFAVSKTSSKARRTDLLAYASNLLAHAFTKSMVVDGEGIW